MSRRGRPKIHGTRRKRKFEHLKIEFTKEFILSLPKTINQETGCWLYTRSIHEYGYGILKSEGILYQVHRLSACIFRNKDYDDDKWLACHIIECKNRNCFNPEHLYVGDRKSNINDAIFIRNQKPDANICSKCGSELKRKITRTGPNRGKIVKTCITCRDIYNAMRQFK